MDSDDDLRALASLQRQLREATGSVSALEADANRMRNVYGTVAAIGLRRVVDELRKTMRAVEHERALRSREQTGDTA